jgi:aspartate kinase
VHVRSSFTTHDGTRVRGGGAPLERVRVLGVAHRDRDPLYAVPGRSAASVVAALEAAAVTVGTLVRDGSELCFTAPGAERSAVTAALAGARVRFELGAVSLVGTGIGTRPDVTARALDALARAAIEPRLTTSCPGRAGFHVAARVVGEAARVLHRAFDLDEPRITALAEAS